MMEVGVNKFFRQVVSSEVEEIRDAILEQLVLIKAPTNRPQ